MRMHTAGYLLGCLLVVGAAHADGSRPTPTATPTPATGREALKSLAQRIHLKATPAAAGSILITDETLELLGDKGEITFVHEASTATAGSSVVVQAPPANRSASSPQGTSQPEEERVTPGALPRVLEWRPNRASHYSPYADYTVAVNQPYAANDPLGCSEFSIVSLRAGQESLTIVADQPLDPRCDYSSVLQVSSGGTDLPGSASVVLGSGTEDTVSDDDQRYVFTP